MEAQTSAAAVTVRIPLSAMEMGWDLLSRGNLSDLHSASLCFWIFVYIYIKYGQYVVHMPITIKPLLEKLLF